MEVYEPNASVESVDFTDGSPCKLRTVCFLCVFTNLNIFAAPRRSTINDRFDNVIMKCAPQARKFYAFTMVSLNFQSDFHRIFVNILG